jgi:hypothetical protein
MLRVVSKNVMGRLHVSIYCQAHGLEFPHVLWSKSVHVGPEDASTELRAIADGAASALRAWEQGEFDFSDDCFVGESNNPWNRPAG